jgi:hypothetical protein
MYVFGVLKSNYFFHEQKMKKCPKTVRPKRRFTIWTPAVVEQEALVGEVEGQRDDEREEEDDEEQSEMSGRQKKKITSGLTSKLLNGCLQRTKSKWKYLKRPEKPKRPKNPQIGT